MDTEARIDYFDDDGKRMNLAPAVEENAARFLAALSETMQNTLRHDPSKGAKVSDSVAELIGATCAIATFVHMNAERLHDSDLLSDAGLQIVREAMFRAVGAQQHDIVNSSLGLPFSTPLNAKEGDTLSDMGVAVDWDALLDTDPSKAN